MDNYWNKLAYGRRDLTSCDREPIQFSGAIQSCGWLLVCDPASEQIVAASENCEALLSRPLATVIGARFGDFFRRPDRSACSLADFRECPALELDGLTVKDSGVPLWGTCYRSGELVFIDLEPGFVGSDRQSLMFVESLKSFVHAVTKEANTDLMLGQAAEHFKAMTGFERVMIYGFEPNGDGHVRAEALDSGLEPFKGLYYPASDIPAQARQLYSQSKHRMIVDVSTEPVPVRAQPGLARETLDLSGCAFRSVSPFHIQYLKNMQVRASFSVALNVNGALWGLIACHHYSGPKLLSHHLRSACELVAQLLSSRIHEQVAARQAQSKQYVIDIAQNVLMSVTQGKTTVDAFKDQAQQLLAATRSSGAYLRLGGHELSLGEVPPAPYLAKMLGKIAALSPTGIWRSESVATELSLAPEVPEPAAVGVLLVPLSIGLEDVIMWFRPEFIREVTWGGDPRHKVSGADELAPRPSFALWRERVVGKSRQWSADDLAVAEVLLLAFVKGLFKTAADLSRANAELARVGRAKDEFIGLVSHELRTPLGVIIGWIDLLQDKKIEDAEVNQAIEIIDRNAKLQIRLIDDLLDFSRIISGKVRINFQDQVSIRDLVAEVARDLNPSAAKKSIEMAAQLPVEVIARGDPERLRQVVWNVLSNAIKFTNCGGWVKVGLVDLGASFELTVDDNGIGIEPGKLRNIFERFVQAHVTHANIGGLGLGLSIVKVLVEMHGGKIVAESQGLGFGSKFVVTIPKGRDRSVASEPLKAQADAARAPGKVLSGVRVLIAEDNPDGGLVLVTVVRNLGAQATLVVDGKEAFARLSAEPFDLLLSDVSMPEWDGYELIRHWRAQERATGAAPIAAMALSAYGTSLDREKSLEAGFDRHLTKPVSRTVLLTEIRSLGIKAT